MMVPAIFDALSPYTAFVIKTGMLMMPNKMPRAWRALFTNSCFDWMIVCKGRIEKTDDFRAITNCCKIAASSYYNNQANEWMFLRRTTSPAFAPSFLS
jgi:hypothetical protein